MLLLSPEISPGVALIAFPFQDQHEIVDVVPLVPLVPDVPEDPEDPEDPLDPEDPFVDTFPMQTVESTAGVMMLLGWVDDKKVTPIW